MKRKEREVERVWFYGNRKSPNLQEGWIDPNTHTHTHRVKCETLKKYNALNYLLLGGAESERHKWTERFTFPALSITQVGFIVIPPYMLHTLE